MEALQDIIGGFSPIGGGRLSVAGTERKPFAAIDPEGLDIELADGASACVVVLHTRPAEGRTQIRVGRDARLELTELFLGGADRKTEVDQQSGSECRITSLALTGAENDLTVDFNGGHASCTLHGLFIIGGRERYGLNLHTRHMVPDCTSDSCVKGVASDEAEGRFYGLVYVAPDAQRTDAQQQSRNILLSESARIDTKPQLEIYADDVKCTHGATVGQMDDEAILYMRQRGLSEMQARALQIEGFASDVVRMCGIEELHEPLMELVRAKMQRM